ncbi:MAG: ATP-binding cassette domain-containing protein [Methanophagales archaeon]|nr:ATP-binding cassette domain-containing protein [Methanophagales archaeon]
MIETITILGGCGKSGDPEPLKEIDLKNGDVVSIVGPTGSGKTMLINDIELFAYGDTPTKRRILINGDEVPEEIRNNPHNNPIALITQHTTFLSDLPVCDFLDLHAKIRQDGGSYLVERTLDLANQLCGENILPRNRMTELSGGQTRALLIADAVVIGNSPIILLDEVENAGIYKERALKILKEYQKMMVFVTHDPVITLFSDFRIVMRNGSMKQVIKTTEKEKAAAEELKRLDNLLMGLREKIRSGATIELKDVIA